MQYFFLVSGIIVAVIFNIMRKPRVTLNMVIVKGIASLCFVFTTLFAFVGNPQCPDYLGALIVTGACFGLIGDIVLDLKYLYKADEDKYLNTGFISFLIGHLFYCAGMIYKYGFNAYVFGFTGLCVICGIAFALIAEKVLKLRYGKFKLVTTLYASVLNSAFGMAFAYAVAEPSAHTIVFTVGMFLFLLSDCILSRTYFSLNEKDRNSRFAVVLNHSAYYSAQFLIAFSLVLI